MDLTREQLEEEIREKSRDLEVFTQARAMIRTRVLEVLDSKCLLTPLPTWSGTEAVVGTLDLTINAISRTLEELQAILEEDRKNRPTRPALRLVTETDE